MTALGQLVFYSSLPCGRAKQIVPALFSKILWDGCENDSALAETLKAATAAKERVADFVQKISNDKLIAIEKQKQRQEAAKVAALKSNQDQAAKGDLYGLLRMGERYRDGDGVEKDLAKAKDYLTKAAAAGSPTAADELSKLNQVSTNSPATQ